jgi:hypothetical protein
MSASGQVPSSVDMLRLEYPRTATDIVTNTSPNNESVDMPNPPAWVRQMAGMYRQAQRDLLQYQRLLGEAYDRTDNQIQTIEHNFNALTEAIRYLYQQVQGDQTASQDWVQTELMQVANAAREFTAEVWQGMATHAEDTLRANHYQAVYITRLDDTLAFLQSANHHRNQQMAFQSHIDNWAVRQEQTTALLAAKPQRRALELGATQATAPRTGASGSGNPPQPIPPRENPAEGSTNPSTGSTTGHPGSESLERLIVRTVATTVAATHNATPLPAAPRAQGDAMLTARFKIKDPGGFDGKPESDFRSWWRMVEA